MQNIKSIVRAIRENWLLIAMILLMVILITFLLQEFLLPLQAGDKVTGSFFGAAVWYAPGGVGEVLGWPAGPLMNYQIGYLAPNQTATVTPQSGGWYRSLGWYRVVWTDEAGTHVGWTDRSWLVWSPW